MQQAIGQLTNLKRDAGRRPATASDALDNPPSTCPIWDRATEHPIGSQNNRPEDERYFALPEFLLFSILTGNRISSSLRLG
jgi:hypothetical protein